VYDIQKLVPQGWNAIDHEGYNVWDYFDEQGRYLGPDHLGVEPVFSDLFDDDEEDAS
jgi:hypothetical protein